MNMIKVLWRRFQQCFGTFTMLVVEGSSQTGLFKHLSDQVFEVRIFGNTKSLRVIFFFKIFKIYCRFQKSSKEFRKNFCYWDNCISIGIVKLSVLRTGFFLSAANVLRSSPKIWHVNNRDFLQLIDLTVIDEYDKGAVM